MVTRRTVIGSCIAVTALGGCSSEEPARPAVAIDSAPERQWSVQFDDTSPRFELALGSKSTGASLAWRIVDGKGEVLAWSPLGISVDGERMFDGLAFDTQERASTEISYDLAHGPRVQVRKRARQDIFWFHRSDGLRIGVEVHASGEGAAFRYLLPQGPRRLAHSVVDREDTGFALPSSAKVWSQPYMYPWKFGPSYEYYFEAGPSGGLSARAVFPLLIEQQGRYALITEAGVDGGYAAMQLQPDSSGRVVMCDLPLADEARGEGSRNPQISFPFASPWRIVECGSLGAVFGSTMVTDLAQPLDERFQDGIPEWIRPGKVAWDWWNDRSTGDVNEQKRYVEAAAEFGWTDVLVDADWSKWAGNPYALIGDLVGYAAARNIGIHLWYNSGGPNNEAGGAPRDRIHDPVVRREEFARISALGVRGIKVDFWHSDKQLHIARYLDVLADAADSKLMVNFHGCTLPRGWQRRFPNLMTMEAVRGGETYAFPAWYKWAIGDSGPSALDHVRFALIRNLVGPMDYTPLVLDVAREAQGISYAHSLALPVLFETGLLHCADSIEAYRAHFRRYPWMREFIANLPVFWDESRLLSGNPDSHVIVARRRGTTWYLAGLNALKQRLKFSVDLKQLGAPKWHLSLASDSATSDELEWKTAELAGALAVDMAPSGGFVAVLAPVPL